MTPGRYGRHPYPGDRITRRYAFRCALSSPAGPASSAARWSIGCSLTAMRSSPSTISRPARSGSSQEPRRGRTVPAGSRRHARPPARSPTAMTGADIVFHLAANADVRFGTDHPRRDLEQNTIATFNVLEAMRANGVTPDRVLLDRIDLRRGRR